MSRIATLSAVASLAAASIVGPHSPAAAGDVSIGIRIGTPPPPRAVIVTPPPVVVVPQSPPVVAPEPVLVIEPGSPAYFHEGRYFRFYSGAWFVAERHEGPWFFVPAQRVPRRVLALPGAYARMHPGHLTAVGPHPWHESEYERGHEHEREREHERGHGHGHEGRD